MSVEKSKGRVISFFTFKIALLQKRFLWYVGYLCKYFEQRKSLLIPILIVVTNLAT